jgi:putative membrane protein
LKQLWNRVAQAFPSRHDDMDLEVLMNNSKHLVALAVLLCACASGVSANQSPAAQSFVEHAAQAGMTEVALGRIAMTKSSNVDIRTFGARMVQDHGKANAELETAARRADLRAPTALDAEHRAIVDELSAKSGSEFDTEYARQMEEDHAKAVDLFKFAASSSDLGPSLSGFASNALPTLVEHKKMADDLVAGKHLQPSAASR